MMITEHRESAMRIGAEARALLETITDTTSPEDAATIQTQFDALMERRDALVAQADREERADRVRQEDEAYIEARERDARNNRRPDGGSAEFAPDADHSRHAYRIAFRDLLASGGDISDLSAETRTLLRNGYREERTQTGSSGAAGGYIVPETLAGFINVAMAATGPMYDSSVTSELLTSSGATIVMPQVDDTDNEAHDHSEGDEPLDDGSDDVVFAKQELSAYTKRTNWIKWSLELGQDSAFSFEALLGRLVGERLGRTANRLLTIGDGAGNPLGFMTSAAAGHTATSQTAITFDDILDLVHSVDPAYRNNPRVRFQMHDDTIKALRKLKDGNGRYIWSDGDVTRGIGATLDGKPVSINQAMPGIAAGASPIAFGDFGEYYVRKVGAPLIGISREKFWPNIGIAGVIRLDGSVGNAKAIRRLTMAA